MTKIKDVITNLSDFSNSNLVSITYAVKKDGRGREVCIRRADHPQVLKIKCKDLLAHLNHLAKKQPDDKPSLLQALLATKKILVSGNNDLFKKFKEMTLCQKIAIFFRRFFGNLGQPSHEKRLAKIAASHIPSPPPLTEEAKQLATQLLFSAETRDRSTWIPVMKLFADIPTTDSEDAVAIENIKRLDWFNQLEALSPDQVSAAINEISKTSVLAANATALIRFGRDEQHQGPELDTLLMTHLTSTFVEHGIKNPNYEKAKNREVKNFIEELERTNT